jgi:IclR family transcriptional regulator, acetate operon repressor
MSETEPTREPPQYPIESVGNALRLLLMFRESPQVRLAAARDELGIAHSTAHRLMAMLVYHGFVCQDPISRAYVAGPALLDVGLSVMKSMDIRTVAHDLLESLSASTGETAHLAQLEGANVRFLDGVESTRALRVAGRTGRILPAYATSVGKALLAELDTGALHTLYPTEKLPAPPTGKSIRTRSELEAELAKVRRRGYALNSSESEDGVSSVGVAVFHPARGPVAALSLAAPVNRMSAVQAREAAQQLKDAAEQLGKRLI